MIPDRKTLLIADDEPNWRETLRAFLEPAGYRTLLASNGEEALARVDCEPVDCVLLDYQLPGLTGLETLQLIRQTRVELPCIMITGTANRLMMREALALKVFTVLSKPVSREVVTISVRRALSRPTLGSGS